MIKVGIIGGAGYTAGELIRILLNHPQVEIAFVQSSSNAGNPLWAVHSGLYGDTDLRFCEEMPDQVGHDVDVVFMCGGHGKSSAFWAEHKRPAGLKVIDLAQDYRDEHDGYVYGLPELQRERLPARSWSPIPAVSQRPSSLRSCRWPRRICSRQRST